MPARGNTLYNFLCGPYLTPAAVGANTSAEQAFTVGGLNAGDVVAVNLQATQTAGLGIVNSRVSAADVLAITFQNSTAGSLTPVVGLYVVNVQRPENVTLPTTAV
jgi:hypothetical protein